MEGTCGVLGNESHCQGCWYRVFVFTSFQKGGSFGVYFVAFFRYVALPFYEHISNYLFWGRTERCGHYLHLAVMHTLGEELRPMSWFKEGLRDKCNGTLLCRILHEVHFLLIALYVNYLKAK